MLYLGHFSFSFKSRALRKSPQYWHGHFTALAEAPNVSSALKKLETLVRQSAESSELFSDVTNIFLESCVELKSMPRAGFLAHVALDEGESLGSISMTLPAVNRKHATSYHLEPDAADEDGGFDAEPFIVLEKKKRAGKAAGVKAPKRKSAAGAARTPAK